MTCQPCIGIGEFSKALVGNIPLTVPDFLSPTGIFGISEQAQPRQIRLRWKLADAFDPGDGHAKARHDRTESVLIVYLAVLNFQLIDECVQPDGAEVSMHGSAERGIIKDLLRDAVGDSLVGAGGEMGGAKEQETVCVLLQDRVYNSLVAVCRGLMPGHAHRVVDRFPDRWRQTDQVADQGLDDVPGERIRCREDVVLRVVDADRLAVVLEGLHGIFPIARSRTSSRAS